MRLNAANASVSSVSEMKSGPPPLKKPVICSPPGQLVEPAAQPRRARAERGRERGRRQHRERRRADQEEEHEEEQVVRETVPPAAAETHAPDAVERVFHAAQHEHREAEDEEQSDHARFAARRGLQQPVDERVEVLVDLAQRRVMIRRRSFRHDLRRGVFHCGDDRALRRIILRGAARQDEAGHREREAEQRPQRHQRVVGERRRLLRQPMRDDAVPRRREHAPERLHRAASAALRERFR